MSAPGARELDRRQVLRAAAWTAPLVLVAAAAPGAMASGTALRVELVTTGLAGGGYEVNLQDGKNTDSASNTSPTGILVVVAQFRVVDDSTGTPVPNVTWSVAGDDMTDGGNSFIIGFFTVDYNGPFTEASGVNQTKRSAAGVSLDGSFAVKINTSTWSQGACVLHHSPPYNGNLMPAGGTFTVSASATGYPPLTRAFTYRVFDAGNLVSCVLT